MLRRVALVGLVAALPMYAVDLGVDTLLGSRYDALTTSGVFLPEPPFAGALVPYLLMLVLQGAAAAAAFELLLGKLGSPGRSAVLAVLAGVALGALPDHYNLICWATMGVAVPLVWLAAEALRLSIAVAACAAWRFFAARGAQRAAAVR